MMALEDILERVEKHLQKRFITTQERYQRVNDELQALPQNNRTLDEIALALKKQSYRHHDDNLEEAIARVDSARSHRQLGPHKGYQMLTNSKQIYTDRFQEITQYFSTGSACYDDLRLVRDYLESNSYLRRKEKKMHLDGRGEDPYFRAKRRLERTIENQLVIQETASRIAKTPQKGLMQKAFPGRKRWIYRGAIAATGAALAAVGIPIPVYLALL